jgi:hypothetical protein
MDSFSAVLRNYDAMRQLLMRRTLPRFREAKCTLDASKRVAANFLSTLGTTKRAHVVLMPPPSIHKAFSAIEAIQSLLEKNHGFFSKGL